MANQPSEDQVLQAIDRVQRVVFNTNIDDPTVPFGLLFAEDHDWLVIMQVLMEQGILPSTPQRPPIAAFLRWLKVHKVRTYLTKIPSDSVLSDTWGHLNGQKYPWMEVAYNGLKNTLPRWRRLYEQIHKYLNM